MANSGTETYTPVPSAPQNLPVNAFTLGAVGLSCAWSGALTGVAAGLVIGGLIGWYKKK